MSERLTDERLAVARKVTAGNVASLQIQKELLDERDAQQAEIDRLTEALGFAEADRNRNLSEIDRLQRQVSVCREALESVTERKTPRGMMSARCCDECGPGHRPNCKVNAALAVTEVAAKALIQRKELDGARKLVRRLRDQRLDWGHQAAGQVWYSEVDAVLAELEREVGQ